MTNSSHAFPTSFAFLFPMSPADPWQRLTVLARTAPAVSQAERTNEDDARFAADAVGRWLRPPPTASRWVATSGLWETWSLRGLLAAGMTALLMLTWNFRLLRPDHTPREFLPPDAVAELDDAF